MLTKISMTSGWSITILICVAILILTLMERNLSEPKSIKLKNSFLFCYLSICLPCIKGLSGLNNGWLASLGLSLGPILYLVGRGLSTSHLLGITASKGCMKLNLVELDQLTFSKLILIYLLIFSSVFLLLLYVGTGYLRIIITKDSNFILISILVTLTVLSSLCFEQNLNWLIESTLDLQCVLLDYLIFNHNMLNSYYNGFAEFKSDPSIITHIHFSEQSSDTRESNLSVSGHGLAPVSAPDTEETRELISEVIPSTDRLVIESTTSSSLPRYTQVVAGKVGTPCDFPLAGSAGRTQDSFSGESSNSEVSSSTTIPAVISGESSNSEVSSSTTIPAVISVEPSDKRITSLTVLPDINSMVSPVSATSSAESSAPSTGNPLTGSGSGSGSGSGLGSGLDLGSGFGSGSGLGSSSMENALLLKDTEVQQELSEVPHVIGAVEDVSSSTTSSSTFVSPIVRLFRVLFPFISTNRTTVSTSISADNLHQSDRFDLIKNYADPDSDEKIKEEKFQRPPLIYNKSFFCLETYHKFNYPEWMRRIPQFRDKYGDLLVNNLSARCPIDSFSDYLDEFKKNFLSDQNMLTFLEQNGISSPMFEEQSRLLPKTSPRDDVFNLNIHKMKSVLNDTPRVKGHWKFSALDDIRLQEVIQTRADIKKMTTQFYAILWGFEPYKNSNLLIGNKKLTSENLLGLPKVQVENGNKQFVYMHSAYKFQKPAKLTESYWSAIYDKEKNIFSKGEHADVVEVVRNSSFRVPQITSVDLPTRIGVSRFSPVQYFGGKNLGLIHSEFKGLKQSSNTDHILSEFNKPYEDLRKLAEYHTREYIKSLITEYVHEYRILQFKPHMKELLGNKAVTMTGDFLLSKLKSFPAKPSLFAEYQKMVGGKKLDTTASMNEILKPLLAKYGYFDDTKDFKYRKQVALLIWQLHKDIQNKTSTGQRTLGVMTVSDWQYFKMAQERGVLER